MVTEKIRWGDVFDICFFDKKTFRAWCTFIGHILIKMSLPLKSENPYRSRIFLVIN